MMGKLATRDNGTNRQLKPPIYQRKRMGQCRIFMIDVIMISKVIKIGTDHIAEIEEVNLVDKVEVDQGMNTIIGEEILEVTWEHIKILEDRIIEENIQEIIGMKIIVQKEVGTGLGKEIIFKKY